MNMFVIILLFMAAFAAQYFLTFLQMRDFTKAYKEIRLAGYRAAIGRFSGAFHEGALAMFAINDEGDIVDGTALHGVTVLARFKSFDIFNGYNMDQLDAELCKEKELSYSLTKAVTDASLNYKTIMRGEEVPTPPSPFKKIGNLFTSGVEKLSNTLSGIRS